MAVVVVDVVLVVWSWRGVKSLWVLGLMGGVLVLVAGAFWLTARVDVTVDPGLPQAGWDGPGMYRRMVCALTGLGLAYPPIAVVFMVTSWMLFGIGTARSLSWPVFADNLLVAVVIVVFSVLALWAALHPSNRVLVVTEWLSRVVVWLAGFLCVASLIFLRQDKRFLGVGLEMLFVTVLICSLVKIGVRKVVEH
ncbi:hypothetical protein KIM372_06240 [Bombiscardovia nodaiensis]|uniref:Uncharacterized protein n=1 Tax=Bombiscardovia nodaiensis TaxID=2932181 RepID=A0ABN6SBT1_9BIFI|nr:hypothetical protein KIM372_06240 [Bombiscardovia nodaiensis]